MKSALKQALADCLARLEAGAGIEECLRGHEALAAELRPLLKAAQALRARDVADYRPDAFQRGHARMHAARMSETERGGRPAWKWRWPTHRGRSSSAGNWPLEAIIQAA